METILDRIIAEKQKEVLSLKERPMLKEVDRQQVSFIQKLRLAEEVKIIAEFKRASPSKGAINLECDPSEQTLQYVQAGADAVSVLTDRTFFKGDFRDLEEVRKTIAAPILCKDFIIDPIQIDYAKHAGANLILLIAAALDLETLHSLYHYAISKDLEVLMEVHNEEELEKVLTTENILIGVNNRNLKTFEVDLATTERLASKIVESNRYLISESGIATTEDVRRVVAAGASGILVGETFMRQEKPEEALRSMKLPLRRVASN
ncbi:indole-3-glycerol phosphate synthase TrpC [Robertmurraya korlensis]|uniref:indole-3-glycerol phosphate synthase TrpC n=1 Tax=Robertmurraya korlensis TaxID=519977 RepID=UPI00203E0C90|nr:indole-3-glycerol phosphate synthase TrpC [Robertmurraya korlensis]MCM3601460.1 indole-3-glycerol phosphate synthase TrpC [Robertmurraya korlensis]